jgi:bisphosphoglycerate-dependent phosphoglycerate mutase
MCHCLYIRLILFIDISLADAELTAKGKGEAAIANTVWKEERAMAVPIPLPERMYCSPLTRAMQTHAITFEGVSGQRAVVVEVGIFYLFNPFAYYCPESLECSRVVRRANVQQAQDTRLHRRSIPAI